MAAFAVFCVQAAGDWLWKIPAIVALATVAVAAAIAIIAEPASRPRPRGGRVGLAALAVLAGALMVPGLVSTQLARDSSSLLGARRASDAASYARSAWRRAVVGERARATRVVEEEKGDLSAARDAAKRAVDLEPQQWTHHLLLA